MTTRPASTSYGAPAWLGALVLLALLAGAGVLAMGNYRAPVAAGAMGKADDRAVDDLIALLREGPQATPPSQLGPAERRALLRRSVERDPANGRAWALLGFAEGEAGEFARAAEAFEKALANSRKVALDPWVWCEYADVLGMAQGTLAGRPTEAIAKALELQRDHPKALEMAGSAAYERRDFAAAAHYWQRLLPQLAEGSPPHQAVVAAIARAERQAAVALPSSR